VLDLFRRKKESWISAFIILAVAGVMAFFGFSNSQDNAAPNQPIAWVNGEVITQREFARELEFTVNQYRSALGNKFDEKLLEAFQIPQRTLERMIQFKILCQQAEKMSFFVSDKELSDHIKKLPYFQKDGKFDYAFYSQLPNRGVEEKKQREQMSASRLQNYIASRVKADSAFSSLLNDYKNTEVSLEYAVINFNELAKPIKASSASIEEALKDENELRKLYDQRKSTLASPSQYLFRQIRVGVPFQAKDEQKERAQKKALQIFQQLKPENFQEVAKKESDDEFAKKGGDRSWTSEKDLSTPFVNALKGLSSKQISPSFEAPGGFYIVQLLDKKESNIPSFEDLKKELARDLADQKARSEFIDSLKKTWETKLAEGKPLDEELKQKQIKLKKTPLFSLDKNTIPEIGSAESMLEALFDLTPRSKVAKRLYLYQDNYYYLKLADFKKRSGQNKTNTESDKSDSDSIYQRVFFEDWMKNLEKQASIKVKAPFEKEKTQKL